MNSDPIVFTSDEANLLLAYLDAAGKSIGISAFGNVAFLANKIKSAFPQTTEGTGGEPVKEAA